MTQYIVPSICFFFSSRRRHTRFDCDWSSDVCSSDLTRGEAEAVLRRADVVLNFHYAIDPRLLACARRTALVDIDPGLLQFWMSSGQLKVPPHDSYLTTGETVGTPAARFSDCGLRWTYIRPP